MNQVKIITYKNTKISIVAAQTEKGDTFYSYSLIKKKSLEVISCFIYDSQQEAIQRAKEVIDNPQLNKQMLTFF